MVRRCRCAVQRTKMKSNNITRLCRTYDAVAKCFEFGLGREQFETVGRLGVRRIINKSIRNESTGDAVRPANASQGNFFGHGVEGNPQTHVVDPFHAVIRVVVVPWRRCRRPWLFHQHVLMEEARRGGLHQFASNPGKYPPKGSIGKGLDALPTHIIVKKAPARAGGGVIVRPRARIGKVRLDTFFDGGQSC